MPGGGATMAGKRVRLHTGRFRICAVGLTANLKRI